MLNFYPLFKYFNLCFFNFIEIAKIMLMEIIYLSYFLKNVNHINYLYIHEPL